MTATGAMPQPESSTEGKCPAPRGNRFVLLGGPGLPRGCDVGFACRLVFLFLGEPDTAAAGAPIGSRDRRFRSGAQGMDLVRVGLRGSASLLDASGYEQDRSPRRRSSGCLAPLLLSGCQHVEEHLHLGRPETGCWKHRMDPAFRQVPVWKQPDDAAGANVVLYHIVRED